MGKGHPISAKVRAAMSKTRREKFARMTPEERKAVGAFLREARRKKRIERGLPPVAEKRKHVSSDEFRKIQLSNLRKGQEAMKARKAARLKVGHPVDVVLSKGRKNRNTR